MGPNRTLWAFAPEPALGWSGGFSRLRGYALTPPIPTIEPEKLVAGDTAKWTRSFADYPASGGWTLSYAFRGIGRFDVAATADGDNYAITLAASVTAAIEEGLYEWTAFVTKTTERYTLASGSLILAPNLATITDASRQSHVERMVPLLEAQMEALSASPIESYTIEQQQTIRRNMAELMKVLSIYKSKLNRKRRRGRMGAYAACFGRSG